MPVDVAERERVELVFDVGTQPEHGALHDAGQDVPLEPHQHCRSGVQPDREQQRLVQLSEVDAAASEDARHDQVGRVPEDLRSEDDEGDADDGEHQHHAEEPSVWPHPAQQSLDRRAEVERLLHGDARGGHATAAEADPLVAVLRLAVRGRLAVGVAHAAS